VRRHQSLSIRSGRARANVEPGSSLHGSDLRVELGVAAGRIFILEMRGLLPWPTLGATIAPIKVIGRF
jgi:hypothetical protein